MYFHVILRFLWYECDVLRAIRTVVVLYHDREGAVESERFEARPKYKSWV
jgi:hypothetical protein